MFFKKSLKKKKKKRSWHELCLLCQSTNMVGQLKKAYLHKPIKIQKFLTPARNQKCST